MTLRNMFKICLVFCKYEPEYTYKCYVQMYAYKRSQRYAYKKHVDQVQLSAL